MAPTPQTLEGATLLADNAAGMARRPGDVISWLLLNRMSLAFSLVAGLSLAITIVAITAQAIEPSADGSDISGVRVKVP